MVAGSLLASGALTPWPGGGKPTSRDIGHIYSARNLEAKSRAKNASPRMWRPELAQEIVFIFQSPSKVYNSTLVFIAHVAYICISCSGYSIYHLGGKQMIDGSGELAVKEVSCFNKWAK